MAAVFISYERSDRSRAQRLARILESHGWSVWWDRDVYGGDDIHDTISAALDGARCVVVLWTKTSVTSRWVRDEAKEGLDRGVLVPLHFDGVQPPLGFRTVHSCDAGTWDGETDEGLEEFLRSTGRILGREIAHEPASRRSSPTRFLTVVTLVVLAAAFWIWKEIWDGTFAARPIEDGTARAGDDAREAAHADQAVSLDTDDALSRKGEGAGEGLAQSNEPGIDVERIERTGRVRRLLEELEQDPHDLAAINALIAEGELAGDLAFDRLAQQFGDLANTPYDRNDGKSRAQLKIRIGRTMGSMAIAMGRIGGARRSIAFSEEMLSRMSAHEEARDYLLSLSIHAVGSADPDASTLEFLRLRASSSVSGIREAVPLAIQCMDTEVLMGNTDLVLSAVEILADTRDVPVTRHVLKRLRDAGAIEALEGIPVDHPNRRRAARAIGILGER